MTTPTYNVHGRVYNLYHDGRKTRWVFETEAGNLYHVYNDYMLCIGRDENRSCTATVAKNTNASSNFFGFIVATIDLIY